MAKTPDGVYTHGGWLTFFMGVLYAVTVGLFITATIGAFGMGSVGSFPGAYPDAHGCRLNNETLDSTTYDAFHKGSSFHPGGPPAIPTAMSMYIQSHNEQRLAKCLAWTKVQCNEKADELAGAILIINTLVVLLFGVIHITWLIRPATFSNWRILARSDNFTWNLIGFVGVSTGIVIAILLTNDSKYFVTERRCGWEFAYTIIAVILGAWGALLVNFTLAFAFVGLGKDTNKSLASSDATKEEMAMLETSPILPPGSNAHRQSYPMHNLVPQQGYGVREFN